MNSSNDIGDEKINGEENVDETVEAMPESIPEPAIKPPSGQSTLFGGEQ